MVFQASRMKANAGSCKVLLDGHDLPEADAALCIAVDPSDGKARFLVRSATGGIALTPDGLDVLTEVRRGNYRVVWKESGRDLLPQEAV